MVFAPSSAVRVTAYEVFTSKSVRVLNLITAIPSADELSSTLKLAASAPLNEKVTVESASASDVKIGKPSSTEVFSSIEIV